MERKAQEYLLEWKGSAGRKPLVMRGARQVGKTHLARHFGKGHFRNVVEFNFDQHPRLERLFESGNAREILELAGLEKGQVPVPGETLLFLDEIQAAPEVLPKLRYFYEELPGLHVIAAGSLLEFSRTDQPAPIPAGRIEYLHLGPVSFEEFLVEVDPAGKKLLEFLEGFEFPKGLPQSVHEKLDRRYLEYLLTGGLPKIVQGFANGGTWAGVAKTQDSLLETYQDDFAKYRGRVDNLRLRKVFHALPGMIGSKLKYAQIDREETARDLRRCVDLLELARVITRVKHSAANAVPLGAETKDRDYKPLFIDVGLVSRTLGLTANQLLPHPENLPARAGLLAEQFIGQHLLYSGPGHKLPELYYWRRQAKSANAELDYLYALDDLVVPIEVKSGKTGTLRSLHQFLAEKHSPLAVRFNRAPPSLCTIPSGPGSCQLLSLPGYFVGQMERLLRSVSHSCSIS